MLSSQRNQLAALGFATAMCAVVLPVACGGDDPKTVKTSDSASSGGGATGTTTTEDSSTVSIMDGPMTGSGTGGAASSSTAASSSASTGEGGTGMAVYNWDAAYGGTTQNDSAVAFDLAVDKSGSAIVVGSYRGAIDFDGAGGNNPNNATGGNDIFIAKYDNAGKLLWRKAIGASDDQSAQSVAVDANNNIAVCGIFKGTVNFGGNNLTFAGNQYPDLFVALFDSAGNHVASAKYGTGVADSDFCYGVAFDNGGNVLATGQFQSSIQFGATTLTAAGGMGDFDMFLAKLQPNAGTFTALLAKSFGAADSASEGHAVAGFSNGDIAIGGWSNGPIDFGAGALTPVARDTQQPVVARLDGSGTQKFAKMLQSDGDSEVNGVAFDSNGDLLVGGDFRLKIALGGASAVSAIGGSDDVFVARYDTSGKHLFGVRVGDGSGDELAELAVDPAGFPVLGGSFQGTVKINSTTTLKSAGNRDGNVVKLANDDGHGYWGYSYGDADEQQTTGVAVASNGNTLICGTFKGTIDLGGGARTAPNGSQSFFIASFGP